MYSCLYILYCTPHICIKGIKGYGYESISLRNETLAAFEILKVVLDLMDLIGPIGGPACNFIEKYQ